MKKQILSAVTLAALALSLTITLSSGRASAQEVASARATVAGRAAGGARLLKRVMLSTTETAEGSRVRITSDAALEGHRTYTEGGRFFVLVPEADAGILASGGTEARGFSRVEAGQRGDDALIAFTLAPGVAPRLRASFNRLDILFAAQPGQQPAGGSDGAAAAPSPTPPPADPTNAASDGKAATPESKAPSATPAGGGATNKAARLAALLTPEKVTPTRLARFDTPPAIDGKLDEEVWKTAAVFKDFVQNRPVDLVAPSQPTEVRIGYDSRFLYVAFRAWDEPGKVRATIAKRDAVFDDDWVGIWLDTFNDGRRAYELIFNPLGVQADAIFTEGVNEDFSVDIVHESKGVLLADGYTVEVAIPFKSLRYEVGKDKKWGLHLLRTIKRLNNEQSSWMPISRDNSSLLGQEGHVTGLEGISTERTVELIPSLTVAQAGSRVPSVTRGRRAVSRA
ncbi:MAG TPA: carbohydrate binding family 9 domain-containing protein, partial [Pyrinomonadaceae bacterium]